MYNFLLPKTDGVSQQPSAEMNSLFNEAVNAVTSSGQTQNNSDNFQLSKALAIYACGASFFVDSGTANNYVLSSPDTKKTPTAYYNGMIVNFYAGNSSTGACTANVATIGTVPIKKYNGTTVLAPGDILAGYYYTMVYNTANSCFDLVNSNINRKILSTASMSATQSIPGGNVTTKLNFDTSNFDNYSLWDSVNKRIKLDRVGQWRVNSILYVAGGGQTNEVFLSVLLNGTLGQRLSEISLNGGNITLSGSAIITCTNIGDYVEMYCNNSNASAVTVGGVNDFEVEFITN